MVLSLKDIVKLTASKIRLARYPLPMMSLHRENENVIGNRKINGVQQSITPTKINQNEILNKKTGGEG